MSSKAKKTTAKKTTAKKTTAKKTTTITKKNVSSLVVKTITPNASNVFYSTTPVPTGKYVFSQEEQRLIFVTFPPASQQLSSSLYLTTSLAPSINMTQTSTTVSPLLLITETLEPSVIYSRTDLTDAPVATLYDPFPNLNFTYPILSTNTSQAILSNSTTANTPLEKWIISTSSTLNTTTTLTVIPTTEAFNFLIGNGVAGSYTFTNIDTVSPSFSQYGIVQYNSTSYDGTYKIILSYDVTLDVVGSYLLTFYVQARPPLLSSNRKTWKVKYNDKHTIQASINNYSTTDLSLGTETGVWKQQELTFKITKTGTYPLVFTSTLTNASGTVDSSIAFGAITIEST